MAGPAGPEAWRASARAAFAGQALPGWLDPGAADGPLAAQDSPGAILWARPGGAPWQIVERIDATGHDWPATAAAALSGGADAIELDLGAVAPKDAAPALTRLASGERRAGLRLHADGAAIPISHALAEAGLTDRVTFVVADPRDAAAIDPAAPLARAGALLAAIRPGARVAVADGRLPNPAAVPAAGLAKALAGLAAFLRHAEDAGLGAGRAAAAAAATFPLGVDVFPEIARLRAFRRLSAGLLAAAGLAARLPLHAEAAGPAVRDEPRVLFHAATAALAGALGGADSIAVLPPAAGEAEAARLARNAQLILRHEVRLGRVADPGAGSGTVERLTERLAAEAWDLFRRIEREGGLAAAGRTGWWRELTAAA